MKLKEILFGLGLKPPPKEYPFALGAFVVPGAGEVLCARWSHPKERRKDRTQRVVDAYRDFLRRSDPAGNGDWKKVRQAGGAPPRPRHR